MYHFCASVFFCYLKSQPLIIILLCILRLLKRVLILYCNCEDLMLRYMLILNVFSLNLYLTWIHWNKFTVKSLKINPAFSTEFHECIFIFYTFVIYSIYLQQLEAKSGNEWYSFILFMKIQLKLLLCYSPSYSNSNHLIFHLLQFWIMNS